MKLVSAGAKALGRVPPLALGIGTATHAGNVGLRAQGGTQGGGVATPWAVVTGSGAVIAVDFVVTKILIATMY